MKYLSTLQKWHRSFGQEWSKAYEDLQKWLNTFSSSKVDKEGSHSSVFSEEGNSPAPHIPSQSEKKAWTQNSIRKILLKHEKNFFIGKNCLLQFGLEHGERVWWIQGHCGGHNAILNKQIFTYGRQWSTRQLKHSPAPLFCHSCVWSSDLIIES